jgi:hypothetical protein
MSLKPWMIFSGGLYPVMQKKEKKQNAQAYFVYEQVTIEELPLDV